VRRITGILTAGTLAVSVLVSACVSHETHRFIRRSGTGPIEIMVHPTPKRAAAAPPAAAQPPIRAATSSSAQTVESLHPEVGKALVALQQSETPAAHVRVGLAYYAAHVLDAALEHFDAALKLDSRLAGAYDGRARVWRDWGLVGPAVSDATRAVYFAPRSAQARNTFGTIFEALGDRAAAAAAYQCAVSLDPGATYAVANAARLPAERAGVAACRTPPAHAAGASATRPADDVTLELDP